MYERFKCFNVNFRLLKTIHVHLLVCYLKNCPVYYIVYQCFGNRFPFFYFFSIVTLVKIPFRNLPLTGTAVAQWLRCCATNRKVAGSNPAGVIGIFH